MVNVSSHADYRHQDYYFERMQSRALQRLTWQRTEAPLRSWSNYLYLTIAAGCVMTALVAIIG